MPSNRKSHLTKGQLIKENAELWKGITACQDVLMKFYALHFAKVEIPKEIWQNSLIKLVKAGVLKAEVKEEIVQNDQAATMQPETNGVPNAN